MMVVETTAVLLTQDGLRAVKSELPTDLPAGEEHNMIVAVDSGKEIARWRGWMITAACVVEDAIVCCAAHGYVYIWRDGTLHTLRHDRPDDWFHAAVDAGDGSCLFGGELGRLILFDLKAGSFRSMGLKDHPIPKPGRTILRFYRYHDRIYLLGKNELLVSYEDGRFLNVLGPRPSTERNFWDATSLSNRLWMIVTQGPAASLGEFDPQTQSVSYHPLPFAADVQRPVIVGTGGELIVGRREIFCGLPEHWREIGRLDQDRVHSLLPVAGHPDTVLAVTHKGRVVVVSKGK